MKARRRTFIDTPGHSEPGPRTSAHPSEPDPVTGAGGAPAGPDSRGEAETRHPAAPRPSASGELRAAGDTIVPDQAGHGGGATGRHNGPSAPVPPTPLRHRRADRAILSLAASQQGVVTREQLIRAGISAEVVKRRIRSRLLRPVHRGVYLVGRHVTPQSQAVAAARACGESAAVSYQGAARLRGLIRTVDRTRQVDISLAGGDRRRPGIRLHHDDLPPDEVTTHNGIPITTPARTLLDIASELSTRALEQALIEAFGRRLTDPAELMKLLERHPRHPGKSRLRAVLAVGDSSLVRSEAEARFRSLVRDARLPEPESNVEVGGVEVDFLWRDERLIVEVDGLAYHSTAERFEADRRRDRALIAGGYRVIRVTWRQIRDEPTAVAVHVARAHAGFTDADA